MANTYILTPEKFETLCSAACRSFIPSSHRSEDEKLLFYRLFNIVSKEVGMNHLSVSFNRETEMQFFVYNIAQLVKHFKSEPFDFLKIAEERFNEVLEPS